MLKYAVNDFVVLGKLSPPFTKNFKEGDVVLIKSLCDYGNPTNEHYLVVNNNDVWWILDSEIDVVETEKLKKEKNMSRKQELLKQIESLRQELYAIDYSEKEDAFKEISEIASQIESLIARAETLAEKHDIQFYYHDGYESFIVDKESSWESSRC